MDTAKELQVLREELIREIDEKKAQGIGVFTVDGKKNFKTRIIQTTKKIMYRREYMKAFTL